MYSFNHNKLFKFHFKYQFNLDNVLDLFVSNYTWRNKNITFNWTMKRTLRHFANSSRLSCLSYSSSVILTTRWKSQNFLQVLIGYVIHKQSKYELFVQQLHTRNKSPQLKINNKIKFFSADNTVFNQRRPNSYCTFSNVNSNFVVNCQLMLTFLFL